MRYELRSIGLRSLISPFAHAAAVTRGHHSGRQGAAQRRRRGQGRSAADGLVWSLADRSGLAYSGAPVPTVTRLAWLLSGTVASRVVRIGGDPVPEIVIETRVEGGEPCFDHSHLALQILILTTAVSYP